MDYKYAHTKFVIFTRTTKMLGVCCRKILPILHRTTLVYYIYLILYLCNSLYEISSRISLPVRRSMCDLGILYFMPISEATKIKLSDLASTEPINDFFALTFLSRTLSRFTFCCDINLPQYFQGRRIYFLINNVTLYYKAISSM